MPKTAELTGALLDYWVARAEASGSERAAYYDQFHIAHGVCYQSHQQKSVWSPSTSWAQCGPLIVGWNLTIMQYDYFGAKFHVVRDYSPYGEPDSISAGNTPQEAICRAVVRAAFGDEVPEVTP